MEWLILLVIIPAIVVPVVLLLGFAGCDLVFRLDPPPEPVFEPAFTATLTNNQDQTGQTIVQRIEPARLFKGGSQVQITVRSGTSGNLVIDKMFISQPVDVGVGDPYDSAEDLTEVLTEGAELVPQNTAKTLAAINYTLDRTKPLLIIFDIGSPGAVIFAPDVPSTEATAFIGPGGEAEIADRQPAYVARPRVYLVERIDVA
jgi:hypothetical protein